MMVLISTIVLIRSHSVAGHNRHRHGHHSGALLVAVLLITLIRLLWHSIVALWRFRTELLLSVGERAPVEIGALAALLIELADVSLIIRVSSWVVGLAVVTTLVRSLLLSLEIRLVVIVGRHRAIVKVLILLLGLAGSILEIVLLLKLVLMDRRTRSLSTTEFLVIWTI
jgi:hypothetical protein